MERERERERGRQAGRQTDRQTDRQTVHSPAQTPAPLLPLLHLYVIFRLLIVQILILQSSLSSMNHKKEYKKEAGGGGGGVTGGGGGGGGGGPDAHSAVRSSARKPRSYEQLAGRVHTTKEDKHSVRVSLSFFFFLRIILIPLKFYACGKSLNVSTEVVTSTDCLKFENVCMYFTTMYSAVRIPLASNCAI